MHHFSTLTIVLAVGLASVLSASIGHAQQTPAATDVMAAKDYEIYQWLLERSEKQEHVQLNRRGEVDWIGFEGENRYSCGLRIDDDGHVVEATFNAAGFYNDELEKLAGWKKLRKLTSWHNFRKGELHKYREGENPTSGAGIAAFRDGALESINFGGSPFDNRGIAAAVAVPTLKELIIYHTRVDDAGCEHLRGDTHVEYVRLGPQFSMRITDACLPHLVEMNALKHLEINETRLTWDGLEQLTKLKGQLEKLTFHQSWIDEADLAKLRKALPEVEIEYDQAEEKFIEQMKRRMENEPSEGSKPRVDVKD